MVQAASVRPKEEVAGPWSDIGRTCDDGALWYTARPSNSGSEHHEARHSSRVRRNEGETDEIVLSPRLNSSYCSTFCNTRTFPRASSLVEQAFYTAGMRFSTVTAIIHVRSRASGKTWEAWCEREATGELLGSATATEVRAAYSSVDSGAGRSAAGAVATLAHGHGSGITPAGRRVRRADTDKLLSMPRHPVYGTFFAGPSAQDHARVR